MKNRKKDYIPSDKFELGVWLVDFLEDCKKGVNHYGINEEEIKAFELLVAMYLADLKAEQSLIDQKRTQVKKTGDDRKAAVDFSRGIAQHIKTSSDYNHQVGEKFNIIGAESSFNKDTFKTVLKLTKITDGVRIEFVKSQTEGVRIYRRVKGQENFEFMAYDLHSPYIDTKDIVSPMKLEYYAKGVIDGEEIGVESDTAKITI